MLKKKNKIDRIGINIFSTKHRQFKSFYLAIFLVSFGLIFLFAPRAIIAEEVSLTQFSANNLLDRASQAYFAGNYDKAISLWLEIVTKANLEPPQLALVYTNLASVSRHRANPSAAIEYWQKAIAIYRENPNLAASLAATLTDTARAYNDLGQTRMAIPLLTEAIDLSNRHQLPKVSHIAYLALGNAHNINTDYHKAIATYRQSLQNKNFADKELTIVTWYNLSKAYQQQARIIEQKIIDRQLEGYSTTELETQLKSDRKMAIDTVQKAISFGKNSQSLHRAKALIQLVKLKDREQQSIDDKSILQQARAIIYNAPNTAEKTYTLIDLSQLTSNSPSETKAILDSAIATARSLDNSRVSSFAMGAMGSYYETQQEDRSALYWTQQAQIAAQQAQSPDSLYRWDWQAARIYNRLGEKKAAITAYENAIASLQLIRANVAQNNSNSQLDFQQDIEPVYRNLIQLLLSQESNKIDLQKALQTKDLLLLSELENFFKDDCFELQTNSAIENTAYLQTNNTATVNTIILEDKTHLIWQFPNGSLQTYRIDITRSQLEKLITQWRFDLENRANDNYLASSQQLYRLLFPERVRAKLAKIQPEKLIFVNDGILRNVPMAALYDGDKFLIENYSVSNSLGLNIRLKESQSNVERALAFGLSVATENFPPLPYVEVEIAKLGELVAKKQFLNQQFNYQNFKQQIESNRSSLIHIATHGQFSGTLEDTFLQAYNRQISLPQLEEILGNHNNNFPNNPIELLVLSACETASSNPRATLGMSGVAIRSGVSNVLGSLWAISDREIVSLIDGFYRSWLQKGLTPDEALRQAQLDLIKTSDSHPSNWSSMILIRG